MAKKSGKSKGPTVLNSLLRNIRLLSPITRDKTLEWTADRLGIPKGQLSKLERGELLEPKEELLEKMLELYECPSELEMFMRVLSGYEPSDLNEFGMPGNRMDLHVDESAQNVTDSGAHNIIRFCDDFLTERFNEVYLQWTTYHVSIDAIRNSIKTDKNHWLLARHRREWFAEQAAMPIHERKIHIVQSFADPLVKGSNTVYVDRLFAYQELEFNRSWRYSGDVRGVTANAEVLERLQKISDEIVQTAVTVISPGNLSDIIENIIKAETDISKEILEMSPWLKEPRRSWR